VSRSETPAIGYRAAKPADGPFAESILSDTKGLRRHFRVAESLSCRCRQSHAARR
jgi:hypothetical protein